MRIFENATNEPQFRIGINSNYYVYCNIKEPLIEVVKQIGKSTAGIYYNEKYSVWAIRVKLQIHKEKLKKLFQINLEGKNE